MRFPTRVSVLVVVVAIRSSLRLRCSRGSSLDGLDDVLIAGATAQVAVQTIANLFFGGIRIAFDDLLCGHDHSGRAEAALQAVLVPKRFLHGIEMLARQSFDGEHVRAV